MPPQNKSSKLSFIKSSAVRKEVRLVHGKRVSKDFLEALDRMVQRKVREACKEHNGGKKTLDASLAAYIIGV
jgi:hypothetical protein